MRKVRIYSPDGKEHDRRLFVTRTEAAALYLAGAYAGFQIVWMSCVTFQFVPIIALGAFIGVGSVYRLLSLFGR